MSFPYWLTVAALVVTPLAATAQQTSLGLDPLDANAPVSPTGYISAFENYRVAGDEETSPDKLWRDANNEMKNLGGHAGHMKAAQPASTEPKQKNVNSVQAAEDKHNQAAPKSDPHAGHGGHHGKGN